MALQAHARRMRQATPERWQAALKRALDEGVEVRQVNENGMWVANSGTQVGIAYLLEIAGGMVQSCSCPAGQFGDPCCKHAARYYLDAGVLDLDPDPGGPAPSSPDPGCFRCRGFDAGCPACAGAGIAALSAQAAALLADADRLAA